MDFGGETEGDAPLSRAAYVGTCRVGAQVSAKPGGTAGELSLLSLQKSGDRGLFIYKDFFPRTNHILH